MKRPGMPSEKRSGIIPINKPSGISSSRTVLKVKKALSLFKAGHSGTLDPMATGVLIVLSGSATKIVPYIEHWEKTYEACATLGIISDTDDMEGKLEKQTDIPQISEDQLVEVLRGFEGVSDQLPPVYSAKKIDGKPMYKHARSGKIPERKTSKVNIKKIEFIEYNYPDVRFKVVCSSGTYIRSICRDLGERLKTGACMRDLVRTSNGPYGIDKAVELEDALEAPGGAEKLVKKINPDLFAVSSFNVKFTAAEIAQSGGNIFKRDLESSSELERIRKKERYSLVGGDGEVAGIFESVVDRDGFMNSNADDIVFKPCRIFN